MAGFDPDNPDSIADTLDFKIYRYYITEGANFPTDAVAGMMEALADNSIAQAMFSYVGKELKVAAIMGGHDLLRDDPVYEEVVSIAKRLAEAGFIVATGGGPGAMEAGHLGAMFSGRSDDELDNALNKLKLVPKLPQTYGVVDPKGNVNEAMLREIHAWALPAWEIQRDITNPGPSLAVPTWYYGHEPLTPLATHVAKFFQNSIREDSLLMLAAQGIIYTSGRAGTIQEVFQDAAQNYYADKPNKVCPMVFFASDDFWTDQIPVAQVLKPLFQFSKWRDLYDDTVTFVHTPEEAADFIIKKAVPVAKRVERGKSLGMTAMMQRAV
ncbi:hypothetical protein QN239_07095 [Mycolicibacterium sp. Y3]